MSTFDKQKFGQRLKEMRLKAGYERQIDLAKKLGTVVQTISNYESGSRLPDAEMLARIVEVLPCNADYLLGFEDRPTYSETFISEQTGLSQEAIEILYASVHTKDGAKDNKCMKSTLASQFIASKQFPRLAELHDECVELVLKNELLKYYKRNDYLDEVDLAMVRLFEDKTESIGGKERFELYAFAAKHQAMELYGEFFKVSVFELDVWIESSNGDDDYAISVGSTDNQSSK